MQTSDWIQIIGWPIGFLLGLLAMYLSQHFLRKRKVLSWDLTGRTDILTKEKVGGFGVPIKMLIDGKEESDLTAINIKVKNTGNTVLTNSNISFNFGPIAKLIEGQFFDDLGIYSQKVRLLKEGGIASLEMEYINPRQEITMIFLVSNYLTGGLKVDMAEPGVILKQMGRRLWVFLIPVAFLLSYCLYIGFMSVMGKSIGLMQIIPGALMVIPVIQSFFYFLKTRHK